MKIRTKVLGCFAFLFVLFSAVAILNYVQAKRATKQLVLINDLYLPLSAKVVELRSNIQNLSEDIRRFYFRAGGDSGKSNFSRIARDLYPYLIQKRFDEAESMIQSDSAMSEMLRDFQKERARFATLLETKESAEFEKSFEALDRGLLSFHTQVNDRVRMITTTAESEGAGNLFRNFLLFAVVFGFGIFIFLISNKALSPLPTLINSIKKIADGDFHQSLKVKASDRDEISVLAREYNRMLNGLIARDKKIQRQQQELLRGERLAAVGQLSAEIVHEIRNPLNALSLNIDWLEGEISEGNAEVKKALESLSREVQRLNQITESYLVRARVPNQETHQTDLNSVVEDVVQFTQEEARADKIDVEVDLSNSKIRVSSDHSRMKQALLNIFKNARESMPNGGSIKVQTQVTNNTAELRVADTGHGMNVATQRQAFHSFYTTKTNGTGLGMTLTKNIVEEAQGSIQCESQLGQGTTFILKFPVLANA